MSDPTPILGQEIPTRPHSHTWLGDAASIRFRVTKHVANIANAVIYAGAKSDKPNYATDEDDITSGEQIRLHGEQGQFVWLTSVSGETIAAGDLVEVGDAVGRVLSKTAGAGWAVGRADENVSGVSKVFRVEFNPEYLDS